MCILLCSYQYVSFFLFFLIMVDGPDMVVSGVPQENGINHAGEIASMAVDLVNVCHNFKIPHKPNTQLKIRAGIHSGSVSTVLSVQRFSNYGMCSTGCSCHFVLL